MTDDPIITDDNARTVFKYGADIKRTRGIWEELKEQTKDAREMYEEARMRFEGFANGLKESHPLFDKEGAA